MAFRIYICTSESCVISYSCAYITAANKQSDPPRWATKTKVPGRAHRRAQNTKSGRKRPEKFPDRSRKAISGGGRFIKNARPAPRFQSPSYFSLIGKWRARPRGKLKSPRPRRARWRGAKRPSRPGNKHAYPHRSCLARSTPSRSACAMILK